MPKIDRDEIIESIGIIAESGLASDDRKLPMLGVLSDLLANINDSICELTEAVQAAQPVSSAERSHADNTQDPSSS